ncbi:HAD family phosphatase [Actinoplanes sichuanensis]|nr:HAD family phosphatase [Actinoplanes sichuanensis]
MPEAMLFDLFGVIALTQSAESEQALASIAGAPVDDFLDAYWRPRAPYDRGELTAADYWRQVAADLGAVFDDDRVGALVTADVASWAGVDEAMVAYVERAAASAVRLGLLSNIPEDLAADFERRHRWLRCFEVVAFSCRTGLAKPDPEAYLHCCREFGLAPERVLFIDDRTENVRAAERLGMAARLFTGGSEDPFEGGLPLQ